MRLLLPLLLITGFSFGQLTYVPDDALEAWFEMNGCSDGTPNNDYISTSGLQFISIIIVPNTTSDLTGIEDCTILNTIQFMNNNGLTSVDLSNLNNSHFNTSLDHINIYFVDNPLIQNIKLPSSTLPMDIAVQNNNSLSNIDFSSSVNLCGLHVTGNNSIESIDISGVNSVTTVSSAPTELMIVNNPSLNCVNLNNGYCVMWANVLMGSAFGSLACVQVDDVNYSSNAGNWNWNEQIAWDQLNPGQSANNPYQYVSQSNPCGCSVGLEELSAQNKELVKITNLLGQEVKFKPNTPLIYIYSDGSTERVMKLEE